MTDIIDAINSQKRKKCWTQWSLYGGLVVWWSQALDPLQPIVHLFARHCYLPPAFMECDFIQLIKDNGGDITLVSNYMAIAISNVETKLLESVADQ